MLEREATEQREFAELQKSSPDQQTEMLHFAQDLETWAGQTRRELKRFADR